MLTVLGFSIIDIVKNNPKELTIYFGGPRGKAIRQNYMSMTFETVAADGSIRSEKIFKEVDEDSTSYTYRSPTGLLSATQFTQPALTLMEKASFEDMRSKGLVQNNSSFAGHSLGEYSALAALAEVMPIESLVSVVYYRGLTMQVAVERDETGRSNYSMCAVNPSRISKSKSTPPLNGTSDTYNHQPSTSKPSNTWWRTSRKRRPGSSRSSTTTSPTPNTSVPATSERSTASRT